MPLIVAGGHGLSRAEITATFAGQPELRDTLLARLDRAEAETAAANAARQEALAAAPIAVMQSGDCGC